MHGKKYEGLAIDAYAKRLNVNVSQCGILCFQGHTVLGCSLHGLIDSDGIIEIKCPYTARNMKITPLTGPVTSSK